MRRTRQPRRTGSQKRVPHKTTRAHAKPSRKQLRAAAAEASQRNET